MIVLDRSATCPLRECSGPDGEPRPLRGVWRVCRSCGLQGQAHLIGLPGQYVNLTLVLAPGSTSDERVTGGSGFASSSPVRDAVLSAMSDLSRWAVGREDAARDEITRTPRTPRVGAAREAVLLDAAVAYLTAYWSPLMTSDLAPALVAAVNGWHQRIDVILGWNVLVHRLPAPCPYCDTMTLYRVDGDSRVRCSRCSRSWLEAEYRHLVRMLLDQERS